MVPARKFLAQSAEELSNQTMPEMWLSLFSFSLFTQVSSELAAGLPAVFGWKVLALGASRPSPAAGWASIPHTLAKREGGGDPNNENAR